jgi:rubrerythrin
MDILNLAVEMETEGEKFYLEQEENNDNYGIKAVCSFLAKEEAKHREIIESKISGSVSELKDGDLKKCIKEIYPEDQQFEIEIKAHPEQFDFYRLAMGKEQKSIELYKELLGKSEDEEVKKILLFLIAQEEKHYKLFDEMAQMLRHADEWVEAPEFGMRKEEY